jgi:hypothetical protein
MAAGSAQMQMPGSPARVSYRGNQLALTLYCKTAVTEKPLVGDRHMIVEQVLVLSAKMFSAISRCARR